MSLGLAPLSLFLLYACREDVERLSVRPLTLAVWAVVAGLGWWLGAWPVYGWSALGCFAVLWVAGVGVGDRLGGVLIGGLLGPSAFLAISLALVGAFAVCWQYRRSPHALPLYPFLSLGVAGIIAYQVIKGL